MGIHPPITGTESAGRLAANARSVGAFGQFLFAEERPELQLRVVSSNSAVPMPYPMSYSPRRGGSGDAGGPERTVLRDDSGGKAI